MKKVYISGKITGIDNHAELFSSAELELKSMGFHPINPVTINHEHDKSWESYMKEDIKALCDCTGIYMLRNWKKSTGAKIEYKIAMWLGMDIYFQPKKHTI